MERWKLDVCRKLRETVKEHGQVYVNGAIVIGPFNTGDEQIGGHQYIYAPTAPGAILANTTFEIARFFEEV